MARAPATDAFPALPMGKKPTSSVFSPGYRGAGVMRVNSAAPSASPWGPGGSGVTSPIEGAVEDSQTDAQGGKRKGNKGKKQVLYNWG